MRKILINFPSPSDFTKEFLKKYPDFKKGGYYWNNYYDDVRFRDSHLDDYELEEMENLLISEIKKNGVEKIFSGDKPQIVEVPDYAEDFRIVTHMDSWNVPHETVVYSVDGMICIAEPEEK